VLLLLLELLRHPGLLCCCHQRQPTVRRCHRPYSPQQHTLHGWRSSWASQATATRHSPASQLLLLLLVLCLSTPLVHQQGSQRLHVQQQGLQQLVQPLLTLCEMPKGCRGYCHQLHQQPPAAAAAVLRGSAAASSAAAAQLGFCTCLNPVPSHSAVEAAAAVAE
jgi:hypothetical protein